MDRIASTMPEYETVMNIYGVGSIVGPQLMAEIGDTRRFHISTGARKTAIIIVVPKLMKSMHLQEKPSVQSLLMIQTMFVVAQMRLSL